MLSTCITCPPHRRSMSAAIEDAPQSSRGLPMIHRLPVRSPGRPRPGARGASRPDPGQQRCARRTRDHRGQRPAADDALWDPAEPVEHPCDRPLRAEINHWTKIASPPDDRLSDVDTSDEFERSSRCSSLSNVSSADDSPGPGGSRNQADIHGSSSLSEGVSRRFSEVD